MNMSSQLPNDKSNPLHFFKKKYVIFFRKIPHMLSRGNMVFIMFLFFTSPFKVVENAKISLSSHQHDIFQNYSNHNFSQRLNYNKNKITAEIKSTNLYYLPVDQKIAADKTYISGLHPEVQLIINNLMGKSHSLKSYIKNISNLLKDRLTYTEENIPQDIFSVIVNKKANCIGYFNLVTALLKSAGIRTKPVKGFYLRELEDNTLIPVPHKWVEIVTSNKLRFFFDPQQQTFSTNYIVTKENINFTIVKKFDVLLLKKSKKIIH